MNSIRLMTLKRQQYRIDFKLKGKKEIQKKMRRERENENEKKKRQMKMERNPIFTFSRADTFGYGGTQTHFVAGEEKVAVLFLLETSRHRQTGRRTGLGKNHSGACLSVFSPLLSLMTR